MCSRVHLLWMLCGLLAGSDCLVAAPPLQQKHSELPLVHSLVLYMTESFCVLCLHHFHEVHLLSSLRECLINRIPGSYSSPERPDSSGRFSMRDSRLGFCAWPFSRAEAEASCGSPACQPLSGKCTPARLSSRLHMRASCSGEASHVAALLKPGGAAAFQA